MASIFQTSWRTVPGLSAPHICVGSRNSNGILASIAIAVDRPALKLDAFAAMAANAVPDLIVALQPGLNYLTAPWPIDELMKLYLTETAPEHYVFEPAETRIEIRGARGEFHINRLEAGAFAFRIAIFAGESIGAAAERALETDATFDPGQALAGARRRRTRDGNHAAWNSGAMTAQADASGSLQSLRFVIPGRVPITRAVSAFHHSTGHADRGGSGLLQFWIALRSWLFLLTRGPGPLSLDHLLERRLAG